MGSEMCIRDRQSHIQTPIQCRGKKHVGDIEKKVNVGIIVQLSKDLMDWVSRRLCYVVGDTDRSVS